MPTAWSWLVSIGTWAHAHQSIMLVAAGLVVGVHVLRGIVALVRRARL
jgi:hypothetical protein